MKIIAILASYNEQRFIGPCLEHYLKHGIYVYLLDNESTDETVAIAKQYLNRNLVGISTIPRKGTFQLREQLLYKESIAEELDADWLIHADVDEFRLPPNSNETLAQAIQRVDSEGYNAINFMEYTFLPVRESPDHDTADFQNTMRWYYPFAPRHPHRLNAWKKQAGKGWHGIKKHTKELIRNHRWQIPSVNLTDSGGHIVSFPGIHPYPIDFKMRHYLVLSLNHAIQKYVNKRFDPKESKSMHGWRAEASEELLLLPSEEQMRLYISDDELDPSNPLTEHLIVKKQPGS